MRTSLILILAFCILSSSYAQDKIVYMKGGKLLFYTSVKRKKDRITIRDVDGNKLKLTKDDIDFFCNSQTNDPDFPLDTLGDKVWDAKRLTQGRATVYVAIDYSVPRTYSSVTQMSSGGPFPVYAVEKNGLVIPMETSRKAGTAMLRKLMEDARQPITVEAESFTPEEIVEYLRQYNMQFYERVPKEMYKQQSSVQFHLRTRSDKQVVLTVNDSLTYTMPEVAPLTINLPIHADSKVCISSGDNTFCDLLSGSVCGMKYYEVFYNEKMRKLDLELKSRKEMQKLVTRKKENQ